MSTSIDSINSLGNYMSLLQMNAQSMQQIQQNLFSKIDSNSSGGVDKAEFSDFAKNLSKLSGKSINVDDTFSTYDANKDGALSSDEMKSFMNDNAPAPPDGMGGGMFSMNTQSLQQGQNDLFSKIDSDGSGGIDKTEFSDFAKKVKEHTGKSVKAEDVFSTYDTNNDGTLSSEEMKAFMKDNAPPPPGQMQNAVSAYGTDQSSDPISTLMDLLKNLSATDGSSASGNTNSISTYITKLIESLKNGGSSSLVNAIA